jgi:hypothetical protein
MVTPPKINKLLKEPFGDLISDDKITKKKSRVISWMLVS